MFRTLPRVRSFLRYGCEFLFSMNLAWLVVWFARIETNRIRPLEYYPSLRSVYLSKFTELPPSCFQQVVWSIALAVAIFLCVRAIMMLPGARSFLQIPFGVFCLTAFPLYYLLNSTARKWGFAVAASSRQAIHWLVLEIVVVLIGGAIFYFRRWPIPAAVNIVLVLLHFALWGWSTNNFSLVGSERFHDLLSFNIGTWAWILFVFGFPLLGFVSSVTWGLLSRFPQHIEPQLIQKSST